MSSSSQARGRNTQLAARGVPVPRLRLGVRSATSPRGVGPPLMNRAASSSASVRSPRPVAQSSTGSAAGACQSPRGEARSPSPRGEGRSPARNNPLINGGRTPKKSLKRAGSSARKELPQQGGQEGQSGSTGAAKESVSLAKQQSLRRVSDCSTDCDCTQSSTLSLQSDGAVSFSRAHAQEVQALDRRFDPLLGRRVTYDEMVSENAAQQRPSGLSYWTSLSHVSPVQAPQPSPAATTGQSSTLNVSSSNSSHCGSVSSLASLEESSFASFGRALIADVPSTTEEGPEDFWLLSDVTFTESCATDATAESMLDSQLDGMLRATQGLIRAASGLVTPPVPTSGTPLSGSQSARVVRPASKKSLGSFSSPRSPRKPRRAGVYSPGCAAEVEELRSRVNCLESELQSLRLSATPCVMSASDGDQTALRMLLAEWERQLTEARAHQEEASGDFRDIRNQLGSLMVHVASLSARCGHGASSGTAQTARLPVSRTSAHAAAVSRPVQAPASHLWQTPCTKSTPCINGRVRPHAPAVVPHLRSTASMPSSLSAPGMGAVPGRTANQSLLQRFNSGTVQRFQSVPLQCARQRFSVSSSGSTS